MTFEEAQWVLANFNQAIGRAEGTAILVVELLGRRFGRLPDFVNERVKQLDIFDLREVAARLLTAQTLHEALDIAPFWPRSRLESDE